MLEEKQFSIVKDIVNLSGSNVSVKLIITGLDNTYLFRSAVLIYKTDIGELL